MYSGQPRESFAMQDREAGKTIAATPRSGGGNVGTRGHDTGHLSLLI